MTNEIVVTNGLTGSPGAREATSPPTAETVAKTALSRTATTGFDVTRTAAAPGVMSSAMSSSAPTICTPWDATTPSSAAKTTARSRTGTPAAAASTGSTVA